MWIDGLDGRGIKNDRTVYIAGRIRGSIHSGYKVQTGVAPYDLGNYFFCNAKEICRGKRHFFVAVLSGTVNHFLFNYIKASPTPI